MKWRQWSLIGLVCAELLIGGWLIHNRLRHMALPEANVQGFNPYTAQALRQSYAMSRPQVAADCVALAEIYLAHGFFHQAEACFRRAVQLEQGSAEWRYRWAFSLMSLGGIDEANVQFQRAISAGYGESQECWYFIGRNHLRLEQPELAQEAFEYAAPMPAARYELARLYLLSGQTESAQSLVRQLQREQPASTDVLHLRAEIEHRLGNFAIANEFFAEAETTSNRISTPAYAIRGRLTQTLEEHRITRLVEACLALARGGELDKAEANVGETMGAVWNPQVEDLRSEIAFLRGERSEQQRILQNVVDEEGANVYRLLRLAVAVAADGDYDHAKVLLGTAIELQESTRGQERTDVYALLASIHEEVGDSEGANFASARRLTNDGKRMFASGDLANARHQFQQAVALDTSWEQPWYYLGEIHRMLENRRAAVAAYRKCVQRNPDHGRALAALQAIE